MKDAIIYAGYSRLADGTMKFRTATNEARVNQLVGFGEEVHMILINGVYSKSAAAKELLRLDHANGAKALEAFYLAQVRDENPFARPKKTRTVKVKKSELAEPARDRKGRVKDIEQFYTWFNTKMKPSEAERVRAEFNERVREAYEAN